MYMDIVFRLVDRRFFNRGIYMGIFSFVERLWEKCVGRTMHRDDCEFYLKVKIYFTNIINGELNKSRNPKHFDKV